MSFNVGEQVLVALSPMKGVMSFEKKGNLIPQYISLLKDLDYVGLVSYMLSLPPSLSMVYLVFQISTLQRYYANQDYLIKKDLVLLDKDLIFLEEPVGIIVRDGLKLRKRKFDW